MYSFPRLYFFLLLPFLLLSPVIEVHAQSAAGLITGVVTDTSGAAIPGATVSIENPVSGLSRTIKTDGAGQYQFTNLPFNPYHLVARATGFAPFTTDVEVRSSVAVTPTIKLQVGGASTTVTVSGGDLLETDTSLHTDIDRSLIEKLPLESSSSSVSSLVTLSTPGVAADSNGLFHGLGDHASNSFSVDGQPISDQQSKVFSNQIPSNSIQSIQVISGAPPAEYGDKTSLIIQVTTRSGQGVTKPTGSITSSYGSFGSATGGIDIGYGSQTWGNFFELDGLNTGRFLDTPEFVVFHDKGNEQNVFDRVDYQFTPVNAVHMNLNYSRSWFQTPNAYDNLNVLDQFGNDVGNTDQKSKIETFDIAPTYTRIAGKNAVFNLVLTSAKTLISISPARTRWRILGRPICRTRRSLSTARSPMPASIPICTYTKGNQSIKGGLMYAQTFLRERDGLGIVNPTFQLTLLERGGNWRGRFYQYG